jgi:hypothetical protein
METMATAEENTNPDGISSQMVGQKLKSTTVEIER